MNMAMNDFSKIRNIDDLLRRKELLQRRITKKETILQNDIEQIQDSFRFVTNLYEKINNSLRMFRNNKNLFMIGLQMFQQWRTTHHANQPNETKSKM